MKIEPDYEIEEPGSQAARHGREAFQLFAEAQKLQARADDAASEKERHNLLREMHGKDMEAIAHLSESNYFEHKRRQRQLKEIRKNRHKI